MDVAASIAVKDDNELVAWEAGSINMGSDGSPVQAVRLGTVAQKVLAVNDDEVRINWGYAYLSLSSSSISSPHPQVQAGSGTSMRSAFNAGLPLPLDTRQPRASNDDNPALAGVLHGATGGDETTISLSVSFSYDELRVMNW